MSHRIRLTEKRFYLKKMKIPTGIATSSFLSKISHSHIQIEYIFLVLKIVELLVLSVEFKKSVKP